MITPDPKNISCFDKGPPEESRTDAMTLRPHMKGPRNIRPQGSFDVDSGLPHGFREGDPPNSE